MFVELVDITDYEKNKTEIVYTVDKYRYGPGAKSRTDSKSDSQSESESEGMTNHAEASCWLTSVIQSIRASNAFRKEFAPTKESKNKIKKELFSLFDISEGKNGQKRRAVKSDEIKTFKKLIINKGLPASMDEGFSQRSFLRFLIKELKGKGVEYQEGSKAKKDQLLEIKMAKTVQKAINDQKIAFVSPDKAPKFLPISIDRPRLRSSSGKKKGYDTTSVEPVSISIPVLSNGKDAKYKLVSVVICTPYWHAYTYVIEKAGWVLYDDDRVSLLKSPDKKFKDLDFSAYQDASRHSLIYIYEAA
ncbi:MAG: ubiquitin carboxyl-terminal hydrolase [Verrucomicrobia bacterium]|nr:ubiquitin carboxyl-terminal hydrolase [Verrucomicrobiota bacterium]